MIRHFRTDRQAEFFQACLRVTDCELMTVREIADRLKKDARVILKELKTNDVRAFEWKAIVLVSLSDWMLEHEIKKQERADAAAAAVTEAIATQDQREAARVAALEAAKARHLTWTRELEAVKEGTPSD